LQTSSTDTEFGEVSTESGTWSLDGDELTLTTENSQGQLEDEIFAAEFDGGELLLSRSTDCQDSANKADCLAEKESMHGLSPGSLIEYQETLVTRLTKSD